MKAWSRWVGFPGGNDPRAHSVRVARAILLPVLMGLTAWLLLADRSGDLWKEALAGKKLSLEDCIRAGWHAAALFDAAICLLLYLTAGWWAAPSPSPAPDRRETGCPRFWWAAMATILLGATLLRLPLASGSLWWDEIWTLKNAVLGYREPDPGRPDQLRFKEAGWDRTFFYYAKPTNHVTFAVLSKVVLCGWQNVFGKERWEFSEPIFRLPSLLAGVGSLLALGLLLRLWGWPKASVGAPLLLAIHPWHLRYSVDGRAFGLMFLLAVLAALALTAALRRGRWRDWLAFGFCQALLLWNFPYAIHLCGAMGLAAAGVTVARGLRDTDLWPQIGRLLVGQAAGLMALLPFVLPHVPQILRWTDVEGNDMIGKPFLLELWSALATGLPWKALAEPGTALYPGLEPMVQGTPWAGWVLFGLVPVLMAVGLFSLFRRDAVAGWIASALLLAAPVALLVAYAGTHYFYTRYVIFALVPMAVLTSVAAEWLGGNRPAAWLGPGLLAVALALVGRPQLELYLGKPYAPIRDVATFLEREAEGDRRLVRCVGFNLGGDTPAIYYPWIERVTDVPGLERVIAEEDPRPLYIFYGYSNFNRSDEPDAFGLLDDTGKFERVAKFGGIDAQFHYQILRLRQPNP